MDGTVLYFIRLETSREPGSGLSDPEAGLILSIIGENHGKSIIQRIPALSWVDTDGGGDMEMDDERRDKVNRRGRETAEAEEGRGGVERLSDVAVRKLKKPQRARELFGRGAVDFVQLAAGDVGHLAALWVAPCAGTWRLENATVTALRLDGIAVAEEVASSSSGAMMESHLLQSNSVGKAEPRETEDLPFRSQRRGPPERDMMYPTAMPKDDCREGTCKTLEAQEQHHGTNGYRDGEGGRHKSNEGKGRATGEDPLSLEDLCHGAPLSGFQYCFQTNGDLIGDGGNLGALEIRPFAVTRWASSGDYGWEDLVGGSQRVKLLGKQGPDKVEAARALGIAEYERLKLCLLQATTGLVVGGSLLSWVIYGAAVGEAFAAGGGVGLLYLLLLQWSVDSIAGGTPIMPGGQIDTLGYKMTSGEDGDGHNGNSSAVSGGQLLARSGMPTLPTNLLRNSGGGTREREAEYVLGTTVKSNLLGVDENEDTQVPRESRLATEMHTEALGVFDQMIEAGVDKKSEAGRLDAVRGKEEVMSLRGLEDVWVSILKVMPFSTGAVEPKKRKDTKGSVVEPEGRRDAKSGWRLVPKTPGVRLTLVVSAFILLLRVVGEVGSEDSILVPSQLLGAGCGFFMYKVAITIAAIQKSKADGRRS